MAAPAHQWVFPARCLRVIDGDTLALRVDVGFHLTRTDHFRLLDVDTPEVRGAEREAGLAAHGFVCAWLTEAGLGDWPLLIETVPEPDSFGRYLCRVWRSSDGAELAEDLITAGHDTGRRFD